ncbi:MAG: GNAT family N-acetyltransferase [Methylococcales bacterium]|nr:GNAT family N-acetyltransferase [Methylococcales bacterium]MDD5632271.1 GNAT family N-acetyltransferase [Methylococcales bacterium]
MLTTALRPETVQDEPFLRHLYASTRAEEMAWFPWPEEQKTAFMAMQYDLRQSQYRLNYPSADFLIVSSMGNPAGRIAVHRGDAAFHLIDVALLPEWRGQGIGGRLIADLLAEAAMQAKPVRLHVQADNRAMTLYRRLGFTLVKSESLYGLMEWSSS